jgi:uncharacterized protein YggE
MVRPVRSRRAPLRNIVAAALAVLAVIAAVPAAGAEEPAPSITVLGTGSASGRPDMAEVTAGVVTQAPAAAQALSQNSAAVERVLKVAADQGIQSRDVQTVGISLVPRRAQPRAGAQQPPDVVGYEVSNQVRIKVRDLAMLGRLLDALVGQGANTLGGVAFSIADPSPLLQQARVKAVEDARQKAQAYAAAAGVKLGRILFIRDANPGMPRPVMAARVLAATPVPVSPGEQEIEASVTVTYALE